MKQEEIEKENREILDFIVSKVLKGQIRISSENISDQRIIIKLMNFLIEKV